MKHLKHINELRVQTYRNAANGLRKFGHHKRADDLELYSDEVQESRTKEMLKKFREIYSKFGEIEISVDHEIFKGYLVLVPIIGFFTDYYDEFRDHSSEIEFYIETWFIPLEEDDDRLYDLLGDSEVLIDGLLPLKNFTFKIVKNAESAKVGSTELTNHHSWEDYATREIPISFTNRKSAMLYKKTLKNLFTGDFYYPLNGTDQDIFDYINGKIFNNTGLRNDFGLTIDKLAVAVQKYSINKLYETD